jgi:hypothetical protein
LFEKTLRFCASGEQLTFEGLFFSGVFDEPMITAGLDGRKGDLGQTEGSKQRKQQPDVECFLESEFHGDPLITRKRPLMVAQFLKDTIFIGTSSGWISVWQVL